MAIKEIFVLESDRLLSLRLNLGQFWLAKTQIVRNIRFLTI